MEIIINILKKIGGACIILIGVVSLLAFYLFIFPIGIIILCFCIYDLMWGKESLILEVLPLLGWDIAIFLAAIAAFILGCIINMISLKLGWKISEDKNPCKKEIILFIFYTFASLITSALAIAPFAFYNYLSPS